MKLHVPQTLPQFSLGAPFCGKKVTTVNISLVAGSSGASTLLTPIGKNAWNLVVAPAGDFNDYSSAPVQDDGFRAAGALVAQTISGILGKRAGDAKTRHTKKDEKAPQAVAVQITLAQGMAPENITNLVLGLALGGYTYNLKELSKKTYVINYHLDTSRLVSQLVENGFSGRRIGKREKAWSDSVQYGVLLAHATGVVRDLTNAPSNIKTPKWFVKQARNLVEDIPGLTLKVRDQEWLEDKGFGGVLAVAQGSTRKPFMLHLEWDPRTAGKTVSSTSTTLLVGKGVTFDTGGISLKPAAGMELMKTDMAGGAAVLAAIRALAQIGYTQKIVALIPLAENMPSGSAYRPGDVITQYGGTITEIGNTDAEGRLILADALAYGVKKVKPQRVISVATLTGAAKVALGMLTAAVYTPDSDTAQQIMDASAHMGERFWPMPQPEYLESHVNSAIGDVRQNPAGPGSITAAMFLRRFTGKVPYTHMDIAGPARAERPYDEVVPVASGFGARTLIELLVQVAGHNAAAELPQKDAPDNDSPQGGKHA